MRRTRFIVCIVAMLIVSLQSFAQNASRNNSRSGREVDREALIAERNTYLTDKMALSAEEAALFIPLDNELLRKKFEAGRDCRRFERELNNKEEKTDEEYKNLLKCREEVKGKIEQLDRAYEEKFKKILSAEKILKYQNADKEFFNNYIRDKK